MDGERLIYENERGQRIEFSIFSPFFLNKADGIDGLKNTIYTTKGLGQDGTSAIGSNLQSRNIVVEGAILENKEINRPKLLSILNPKLKGKLFYTDYGETEKCIDCIVETAPKISKSFCPEFLISFYCPSPYWIDIFDIGEDINTWIGGWKFKFKLPFKFKQKGEPRRNIYNDGHVETPVEIIFKGPAVNPKILNKRTGEFIKVDRVLSADDTLFITTEFGNKKVEIERNGVRQNAFNYIDLDSDFFQLKVGDNIIEYSTDNELEPQSVEIIYRNRYSGV